MKKLSPYDDVICGGFYLKADVGVVCQLVMFFMGNLLKTKQGRNFEFNDSSGEA